MESDAARAIGAVTREVRDVEHEGKPARVVVAARTYDTSAEDLWDAITSAERIPRWFLPVSGELRLGGRYQLHGNAGGTITECEPPRRLALTWEFAGGVTWLTVDLSPDPAGGTRLALEHMAHVDERWDQFGPGAVGIGWDLVLRGLGLHLASGAQVDPIAAGAWLASEEGRDFMRLSNEGWLAADIASGADPAGAAARAGRTIAAYTGQPAAG
jgi:uncharacterized protein YndB with AHSA1/START domain